MVWFVVGQVFTMLLDILALRGPSEREKDIEILLLRQQLRIVERSQSRPRHLSRWEKLSLAVLTARLNAVTMTGATRSQTTPSQSVRGNASARPIALTDRSAARARFSRRADAPIRRPTRGGRRGTAVGRRR